MAGRRIQEDGHMMAIQLLKEKLGALEQDAPIVEKRMQSLIERQNKKMQKLEIELGDILRQNRKKLDIIRDVIGFQISIIDQSELIKMTNEQNKDYKKAIERLEEER